MEHTYWTPADDGVALNTITWLPDTGEPKAIVQLSHGMAEHMERYRPFAEYLIEQGILVCGHDHRGHGKTGERQGALGHFSKESGFERVAEDVLLVAENLAHAYPNVPIFLVGHSLGSFIARRVLQEHSGLYAGAILLGTGNASLIETTAGKILASRLPECEPSELMNDLIFGKYNKRIEQPHTEFDWLSRDPMEVRHYIEDKHCGFIPTAGFFHELMVGMERIRDWRKNRVICNAFSLLLVSGTEDPVGRYGKGVWQTAEFYKKAGLQDVAVYMVEGARHEVLNEIGKEDVIRVIGEWIQERI